jgi:DNA mismatch repair protein MutS
MGDFFETFEEDAVIASRVLGIALTKRANGAASDVPLAGFPHHALDNYLPKLVKAGYKVAVCEQLEDPRYAKGIVKRDVVEVVTPGVAFTEKLLEYRQNNYIASVYLSGNNCGFAYCDISTGEFRTSELLINELYAQIEVVSPSEIIIPKSQKEHLANFLKAISDKITISKLDDWIFNFDFAKDLLLNHFKTVSLKGFGIEDRKLAVITAAAILNYFSEIQNGRTDHIKSISLFETGDYISIDESTRKNLEITSVASDNNREGSLLSVIDHTLTPPGARLLRKWLLRPLKNPEKINSRLDAVKELFDKTQIRDKIRNELKYISDLERLLARTAASKIIPKEIIAIKTSLKHISQIKTLLENISSAVLDNIKNNLNDLPDIIDLIENSIAEENGSIKKGYSRELDELRDILNSGSRWLENYRDKEREKTGINSLKIGYNKVFGYYIEISNTHRHKLKNAEEYICKQTLSNAERYVTPQLKEYEEKILQAEEKIVALESELFDSVRKKIVEKSLEIQMNAAMVASLDVLCSFAHTAVNFNYSMPRVNHSNRIIIKEGRHPVIERLLPPGEKFTPNDLYMDNEERQIIIITGPNMSGKSSYLRQTGLIVLLAQTGSFVPARDAEIGVCDRIFTRVGASDNIARGESTFLVEMHEAANILNNLTDRSLVLLDEVGRGTSTYDGISIAWAITEFIHENGKRAKTLFATHYHELNTLAELYPRIKNSRVEVKEIGDRIIFLHKITDGFADHSFGIHVAQMAGLPEQVIKRAREILKGFEKREARSTRKDEFQINLFEYKDNELNEIISRIDIDNLTPLEALNKLQELKKISEEKFPE